MKPFLMSLILGFATLVVLTNCNKDVAISAPGPITMRAFQFESNPEQLLAKCNAALKRQEDRVTQIGNLAPEQVTVENTLLEYERAQSDMNDEIAPFYFTSDVARNEGLRAKGKECIVNYGKSQIRVHSDPKAFKNLVLVKQKFGKQLGKDETDILEEHLREFRVNGTELVLRNDPRAAEFKALAEGLGKKVEAFKANVVKNFETIPLTEKRLVDAGISKDDRDVFVKMGEDGKTPVKDDAGNLVYELQGNNPVQFTIIIENSKDAELREIASKAWEGKGGPSNLDLFKEIIADKDKIAKILGYKNHPELKLENKMVKTPETVMNFLTDLRAKLLPLGKKNLEELTQAKRAETRDPAAKIDYWDYRYYENQLRKTKYKVDREEIKKYFPVDTVTKGVFNIYQTLLGVKFEPDETYKPLLPADMKLYRIVENGQTLAYFFTDLFQRTGKRGGAAAYTLIEPRVLPNGSYQAPVSAIVANFQPPIEGKPTLLSHDAVVTFFHEFGHIMHQTLSKVKYRTFSGANAKWDFVEAPSQMLENWAWKKQGLELLSGRFDAPEQKLPKELLQQLVDSKYLNSGLFYLRQVALALADMTYHLNPEVDLVKTWREIFKETMMMEVHEKNILLSGFTHLVGSYDAGYYSYLWSKRYAEDMFTRFETDLLDPQAGSDYRKVILERGGTEEPLKLVETFIGRPVQDGPFETSLGLDQLKK